MVLKSKQYSRAVGSWLLVLFLTNAYFVFVTIWKICVETDTPYGSMLKTLFTDDNFKEFMYLLCGVLLALLVLMIAMYANNRGLFFLGVLLDAACFGYTVYLWFDTIDDFGDLDWDTPFTLGFIAQYPLAGLVVLFMLLMAIALAAKASSAKLFGVLAVIFSTLEMLLIVALDIIPYLTDADEWQSYRFSVSEASFLLGESGVGSMDYSTVFGYMPRFVIAILVVKWAKARLSEVTADKAKKAAEQANQVNPYSTNIANPYAAAMAPVAPVAAPAAPAAPAQPAYQAPAQPAYQAPVQPEYKAPEQPAYQAPAQPAYQAPEQPVYQTPETVSAAPAEYAAAAVETANTYADAAVDTANNYADAAVDTANNYAGAAVDTANNYAGAAVDAADGYADAVTGTVNDYAAAATETADSYADTMADYANSYADAAVNTANNYADAAVDTANNYADAAATAADGYAEAAENALKNE